MAKPKDPKTPPPRTEPEDLGFAVYTLDKSHFRIPDGSDLATELGKVTLGKTLRREDPRPNGNHVLREVMTAFGFPLDVKAIDAEVALPPPVAHLHLADATGGDNGLRMLWACFEPSVTPSLLWAMLAKDLIEPGDTLWVYADAVAEADAEIMGRIVRLRLC